MFFTPLADSTLEAACYISIVRVQLRCFKVCQCGILQQRVALEVTWISRLYKWWWQQHDSADEFNPGSDTASHGPQTYVHCHIDNTMQYV